MVRMTRRRKLLLWCAFTAILLAALVIVLVVAPRPVPSEASRQIKKIQRGMTLDQVRGVIGMETSTPAPGNGASLGVPWGQSASRVVTLSWAEWHFPDAS